MISNPNLTFKIIDNTTAFVFHSTYLWLHTIMAASNTSEKSAMNNFEFISVQAPGDAKDQAMMRRARSHAVSRGLDNKRKLQQKSGTNFRFVSAKEVSMVVRKRKKTSHISTSLPSSLLISAEPLGVFQMLAAESPRLHILLSQREHFSL